MKVEVGRGQRQQLHLEVDDAGTGPTVVLVHGWPVSSLAWDQQVPALVNAGHRVVRFDRRGFGRSARPSHGYDIDTLADDLRSVLEQLDLRDCALVGLGVGCGEAVRMLGTYGADRVRKLVLVSPPGAVAPACEAQTSDDGTPPCERVRRGLQQDRFAFLERHIDEAMRVGDGPSLASAALRRAHWVDAVASSSHALAACADSWPSDLRDDLPRIGVPTLVVHGTGSHLMAIDGAEALAARIAGARWLALEGAPHGLPSTHADALNAALIDFLK